MTYETQPGTIPHRVVLHLRAYPDREFSTAELGEYIGEESTVIAAFMKAARSNGLVKATTRGDSRMLWWSLGDGKAQAADGAKVDELDRVHQRVVKAADAAPMKLRVLTFLPQAVVDEFLPAGPVICVQPEPAESPTPQLSPEQYAAAIGTDPNEFDVQISLRTGSARIIHPDGVITLTSEQRQQLQEWLAA